MTLTQLRYLVAVVDHRTVSAAARSLHVAQPAVSRAIQALEGRLGVSVFDRDGGRLTVTEHGRDIVDQARRVLAESAALDALADRRRCDASPSLKVVSTPTLEVVGTIPLLSRLNDALDHVRISTEVVGSPSCVFDRVENGTADLGIVDVHPPGHVDSLDLFDAEIVLASPAGSPETAVTVGDLASIPLVAPAIGTTRRVEFDEFFARAGVAPRIAVEASGTGSWDQYVVGGIAAAFQYLQQAELLAPQGVVTRRLVPTVVRHVSLVFRRSGRSRPADTVIALVAAASWPDRVPVR